MKNLNSSPSAAPPASPIQVDIFDSQYSIKPTESLTEDDIRELAAYVDRLMHQASQKGTHDKLSVAIMVALNIAAEMHEEKRRYADSIRQLVQTMDEVINGGPDHDPLSAAPKVDPEYSIQG